MKAHDALYIDGQWQQASGTDTIAVVDPATEQVQAEVPKAGARDVDAAVRAARAALRGWAATPPAERAARLGALRDGLAARRDDLAQILTGELGVPARFSRAVQTGAAIDVVGSFAGLAARHPFEETVGNSTVLLEPVGVVAAIVPWNYPLHIAVTKIAAALAAGCTVVLKPAEETPLNAQALAECVHEAGFPPGVFNLVTGDGPTGQALVEHDEVDMVSFTGSTAVGRSVGALAGARIKRVALELGGKSANVILPSADLGRAVKAGVASVMANSGQTCYAWTRMLVHEDRHDEAVAAAKDLMAGYPVGDPADEATRVGPLVSARQLARVRGYIGTGVEEGARLVTGGAEAPLPAGYFVAPTLFAEVTPDMTIAQEEIFGPVLSVLSYRDEEEALRIADGTPYGLGGAVWAGDDGEAAAFARRMDTGQVTVNGGRFNNLAPFGGYKQSGVGREYGTHGLAEFLQTKSLQF